MFNDRGLAHFFFFKFYKEPFSLKGLKNVLNWGSETSETVWIFWALLIFVIYKVFFLIWKSRRGHIRSRIP